MEDESQGSVALADHSYVEQHVADSFGRGEINPRAAI